MYQVPTNLSSSLLEKSTWIYFCKKLYIKPSWYLLVQSQQWKHQNNMWVYNKDTRMTPLILFWCLYSLTLWIIHTLFQCFHYWLWISILGLGKCCSKKCFRSKFTFFQRTSHFHLSLHVLIFLGLQDWNLLILFSTP